MVLSLFRGPRKDKGEKKKIIVISQWQNKMAQISHQRNVWFWLACKAWQSIGTNLSFTYLVFMWHFLLSVQRDVLELFFILHLLDILSYKYNVCLVSHSHFHYLWGIFLTQIWSSSNGVSHKEQNRSTEGCLKLKRSVNMTSSGKNDLNIRTNASPNWDRTRCPEE